ncbi:hypothetical protein AVEN_225780-1 [Araneus ventricosus]|uniref:Uncharacterized protein n=1 Tax=Araneus ventricosus TaxID=182803 RepID=A0A4Y2BAJ1_ARAVE|nr:hypothetical protein AVEN_225780-1 [Araneus ventricosus]
MLRHPGLLVIHQNLFEIVIVGCSLSETGHLTSRAVLGTRAGYQTTGLMATLRMLRHRWATSHYRQSLFEIVIVGCSISEDGTFGVPKLCWGTTRQATKQRDLWPHYACSVIAGLLVITVKFCLKLLSWVALFLKTGHLGLKLCLGTTDELPNNGTYGHITHAPSSLGY